MKTAEEVLKEEMLKLKAKWRGAVAESPQTFVETYILAMIEYARLAIEEDRKIIAECAQVGMNEGGVSIEIQIEKGLVFVDKDSIINAPKLELK